MEDAGNYSCVAEGDGGCSVERYASLTVDQEKTIEGRYTRKLNRTQ